MLRFAEEILLLTLDDESGRFLTLPEQGLPVVIAGALLMELAFMRRVDADPGHLLILDRSESGDPILDKVIATFPKQENSLPTRQAIARVALIADDMVEPLLDSLVKRGVLTRKGGGLFEWVVGPRSYPKIDQKEIAEVRTRIRGVLLSDSIPSPRDAVIIGLIDACDLYDVIFIHGERTRARERAAKLGQLDLIGREISGSIDEVKKHPLQEIAFASEQ